MPCAVPGGRFAKAGQLWAHSACFSPKVVQQRPPAAASSGGSFGVRAAGAGPSTVRVLVQGPELVPVAAAS